MSRIPSNQENPFSEDPYVASQEPAQLPHGGDATGGLIPYKNPAALISYYLGVFSLIPCLGLFLAVPALILGIVGLRNYSRNPQAKGQVHACIGIIAGVVFTLLWGGLTLAMIVAALSRSP